MNGIVQKSNMYGPDCGKDVFILTLLHTAKTLCSLIGIKHVNIREYFLGRTVLPTRHALE